MSTRRNQKIPGSVTFEHIGDSLAVNVQEKRTLFVNTVPDALITLAQGSELELVALVEEGWQEPRTLRVVLSGPRARCSIRVFIVGSHAETYPLTLVMEHAAPFTIGTQSVRAVLKGSSSLLVNGVCRVALEGPAADTFFSHHTLLLSRDARVRTIPSLEILNDEVSAGHAATVGSVDEATLFYLQSRGLSRVAAGEVCARGFFAPDLMRISDTAIRATCEVTLAQALTEKV